MKPWFSFIRATALLILLAAACVPLSRAKENNPQDLPLLAIWQDSEGFVAHSEAPYLRVAIWSDGRIVFAQDPSRWGHELRQGHVEPSRVAALEKALGALGAFQLKGTCYLVPDAATDCLLLHLGTQQQLLYWDEVESANYGVNISPTPTYLAFKHCWKAANRLALEAIPKQSEPCAHPYTLPSVWRIKAPIQSE